MGLLESCLASIAAWSKGRLRLTLVVHTLKNSLVASMPDGACTSTGRAYWPKGTDACMSWALFEPAY